MTSSIQVDLLITGAQVVCFDDADTILADGAIGITGNSIAWLGTAADAAKALIAKETTRRTPSPCPASSIAMCIRHSSFCTARFRRCSGAASCATRCGSATWFPSRVASLRKTCTLAAWRLTAAMIRSGHHLLSRGRRTVRRMRWAGLPIRSVFAAVHRHSPPWIPKQGPAGEHALLHGGSAAPFGGIGAALARPSPR